MKPDDMKNQINSLASHILFDYNGINCGVDPINHSHIDIWYGDKDFTAKNINEAMTTPLFDGKTLEQICNKLTNIEI